MTFVLDRAENPHPRMLANALEYRAAARRRPVKWADQLRWAAYLEAMIDATGCTEAEMDAWLDSHEGTPVVIR